MARICAAFDRPMLANMVEGGRSPVPLGAQLAELGVSSLPFMWPSPASLQKTLDAGLWSQGIEAELADHDMKGLNVAGGGPYQVYAKDFEVRLPSDLEGKKIAVSGTTRPLLTGLGRNLYEVLDHLTLTNMAYFTRFLVINQDSWDALPADLQEIMQEAADAAQRRPARAP